MTTISGINNSATNAWTEKSTSKTASSQDAALFRMARLDANANDKLSQSEYGTGSASTTRDAARLPPPPAAFSQGAADDTASSTTVGNTLSALFGAVDSNGSGSIDDSEMNTLQQMVQNAMAVVQPSSTSYASTTVSFGSTGSTASATGDSSTTDQTLTERYDLQQVAQQVLKQYQQVSSGASTASATGSTVSKVA